jgi:hypothetical protein
MTSKLSNVLIPRLTFSRYINELGQSISQAYTINPMRTRAVARSSFGPKKLRSKAQEQSASPALKAIKSETSIDDFSDDYNSLRPAKKGPARLSANEVYKADTRSRLSSTQDRRKSTIEHTDNIPISQATQQEEFFSMLKGVIELTKGLSTISGTSSISLEDLDKQSLCKVCGKEVGSGDKATLGSRVFHKDHFRCQTCNESLDPRNAVYHRRSLYCSKHHEGILELVTNASELSSDTFLYKRYKLARRKLALAARLLLPRRKS